MEACSTLVGRTWCCHTCDHTKQTHKRPTLSGPLLPPSLKHKATLCPPTLRNLTHSLSQLDTREVGQQMMTRRAMGVPPRSPCPELSSVHSNVMPCSQFLTLP